MHPIPQKNFTFRLFGVCAALAVYALLPWLPEMVSRLVGTPFLFFFTIVWPGRALARLLSSTPSDAAEDLASWGIYGLGMLLVLAFIWALTPIGIGGFATLVVVISSMLILVAPGNDTTRIRARGGRRTGRYATVAAMGLVVLFSSLIGSAGPPVDLRKDTHDDVAWTNEVARTGRPFPTTAFYAAPGADGGDIRKGLLHAIYGFYRSRLHTDSYHVLGAMAALLFALASLCVYRASVALLESRRGGALAAILFVLTFDGGASSAWIRSWFYPGRFAMAPALLFIVTALKAIERPRRRTLAACGALAFVAVAIHIQYTVLLAFAVFVLLTGKPLWSTAPWTVHVRNTFAVGLAALIAMTPYVLWRVLTGYQSNPLHTQIQWAVFVRDGWFVADPTRFAHTWGLAGASALVGIVALWRRNGNERLQPGVGYAVASVIAVLVIQFNPVLLPGIYRVVSYLVYRLDRVTPYFIIPAAVFISPGKNLTASDHGGTHNTARVASVGLALAACVLGIVSVSTGTFSRATRAHERTMGFSAWSGALDKMAQSIPAGETVVADPVTSYSITAATPLHVLCTLDQHAPPNDRHVRERMLAARDIISPYTAMATRTALLRKWHARFVAINTAVPTQIVLDYWNLPASAAHRAIACFDAHPEIFARIFAREGVVMYRWTGRDGTPDRPELPTVERVPASAEPAGVRFGAIELVAVHVGAKTVTRDGGASGANTAMRGGSRQTENVPLDLYWRSAGAPPGNYVVSIRFDATFLSLPFGGAPFPKLTRKLLEHLRGVRYRFRADRMTGSGIFGPDAWPSNAIVHDRFHVTLPGGLAPGKYTIRIVLARRANTANHRLRDFFYDDDSYNGYVVGAIDVAR